MLSSKETEEKEEKHWGKKDGGTQAALSHNFPAGQYSNTASIFNTTDSSDDKVGN
jgi:hypothetical protein